MPNKCSGCGSLDHILSSCTASHDALMKWTLAKPKLIVHKYGHNNIAPARAALLSDLSHADTFPHAPLDVPTVEECTDVYDDTKVSLSFSSVAFTSSLTPGCELSNFRIVDSACSLNLTEFRDDFVTYEPPSGPTRGNGVGVNVMGSGTIRVSVPLVSSQTIHPTLHALFTPDLSSRFAQRIGRLLSVGWMHSHCCCEFHFPTDSDTNLLVVPT
jgi:hypothetical protein